MKVNLLVIPTIDRPRKRLASHVVTAWVAFSLVGALTVCCELFASSTDNSPPQNIAKVDLATDQHPGHDHQHPASDVQISQSSPDDSEHCIDNAQPGVALSKFLAINTPDPSDNILLSSHDDFIIPFVQVVSIVRLHNDPPPVSTPLYLLFHRLLIAHQFA